MLGQYYCCLALTAVMYRVLGDILCLVTNIIVAL